MLKKYILSKQNLIKLKTDLEINRFFWFYVTILNTEIILFVKNTKKNQYF